MRLDSPRMTRAVRRAARWLRIRRLVLSALLTALMGVGTAGLFVALADPISPFSITNTDSPDPVASGAELTYTITVVNTGGAKATNVVLSDQLNGVGGIGVPPQLVLTSTRGSCAQNNTLVTCSAGAIEGGGSWVVTIRGVVTAANGTTLNNTASVTGTRSAQNFTSTATATTLVTNVGGTDLPDLTISKTGPTTVGVSTPMTYTLTVNNIGTANATGVKVVDTVPAGLTGISASGTSLFACSVAGQTVTCTGGAVNQGSNATITIGAVSPAATGTITNTAAVDPDDTIPEANELNNTSALVDSQVTTSVPSVPLSIDKTDNSPAGGPWAAGAGPDPVTPGELITYKILVANNASTRADDVVMVDGTQGLEAATISVSQVVTNGTVGNSGGCTVAAPQVRCLARTLNPGGTILYTVSGRVVASAGSTIINTASVTGNIRNQGYTSTDTELTTVKPGIDLTVTKADSPDPVCARSWPTALPPTSPPLLAPPVCLGGLRYTFVVGNSGIKPASGVLVRDPLPPGVVLDSFTAPAFGGGCAVDAANVLTCSNGAIGPESTTTITIVLVAPPTTGPITNTVTVDPNNAIFEADETNNTATQSTQVATGVDLVIRKDDSPPDSPEGFDPIATSGTETYTIRVDNVGPQDVTGIRVRDTLPAGTIFRSVVGDHGFTCGHAAGVVECFGGSLKGTASEFYPPFGAPGSDVAVIKIRVFAQPIEGTMHNEVRVDPLNEIAEFNEANNFEFEDTVVGSGGAAMGAFNELTITKTQMSPANPVARNAKVTYRIQVGNDATDPVVGVKVRDFLPAGSRYIEATGTNEFLCTQLSSFVDCVGGEIPAGGTATITLTLFAPDTPGTYTNQAIADPDNAIPEGNEFNNQASVATVVENAGNGPFYELTLAKAQTSPANPVARNAVVTYSLTVGNNGSDPVIDVTVRDFLPAGSRYIEATGTNQFLCTQYVSFVDCVGGQISSGGAATITLKMFAPDTPGTYTNQALVDPDNTIPEGDEVNNEASVNTIVTNGGNGAFNDLQIVKTGSANTTPGGSISYALQVTNAGTDPALNVAVRDVLPEGTTFVSAEDAAPATPGAFTCSEAGGVVDCIGGTLAAGGVPRIISIVVTAPNQNAILTNQAFVDPDNTIPEGDELNNTDTFDTTVQSVVNLKIEKTGPKTSSQSTVSDYVITVTNEASGAGQTAFGVKMHDPLPVGLIPLAVNTGTGNNWACQIAENPVNVVDCLGDLNPNQQVTITITVFMTAESGRSLDNEACVDPDDEIEEFDPPGEGDNCSTHSTAVGPPPKRSPDLLVSKGADLATVTPGDTLTYTISVSNIGSADALSPLTVTDNLPSDVTFVDATGSNGWTCAEALGTLTCNDAPGTGLAVGASTQITVHVTVNSTANLPIANTAVAAPALVDLTPGDTENETAANVANNSSTVVTSVGGSGFDLAIASITDNPDPVNRTHQVTYTVVAVNGGTQAASGVHVAVAVPPVGVTLMGADGSNGFNCGAPVAGTIDCVGDLPAGGDTVITVTFVVLLGAPDDLTLTATIDPADAFSEADEGNNSQTEVTTVSGDTCTASPCIDLVAAQLVESGDPVDAGSTLTYDFVLVNVGDSATSLDPNPNNGQPLTFFDLFGNFTLVSRTSSNPAVTCVTNASTVPGSNLLTDCFGNLGAGEGVTITISVTPAAAGSISASGSADPLTLIDEFLETNNTLSQTTTIDP
jgi:uncharacterized repeat protein (TIGR01451 family)